MTFPKFFKAYALGFLCVVASLAYAQFDPPKVKTENVPAALDPAAPTEKTNLTPAPTASPAENPSRSSEDTANVDMDEDTPVQHEEIAGDRSLTETRPWRAPDFSKQESALGYAADVFTVPAGLETNFQFWLDIYTKYSTDQGVLHDAEYIDLIYETLDFTAISMRTDLTEHQKARAKTKAVKEAKKRIVEMLRKLDKTKDPETLDYNERRVWDAFAKIDEKHKFREAQKRTRLRFQLGQRDRIVQGIFFSGRYLEDFERIFREAGMPIELTRLVFVESSFNVLARSKVGASGLWQIMRYTARPYMMINNAIDKRNHPIEATKLSAKLLRQNYEMLQSWPLAITGYNHGPSGVLKLTKVNKTRDLKEMILDLGARRRLGFASRNFYMSFLAALEAERNAPKYFGPVLWSQNLMAKDLKLETQIRYADVLRWFDGDDDKAQIFNPHITSSARKQGRFIPKGAIISIPASREAEVLADLEKLKTTKPMKTTGASTDAGKTYKVIQGDTISSISKDFGVRADKIIQENNLRSPNDLRVGDTLMIPEN